MKKLLLSFGAMALALSSVNAQAVRVGLIEEFSSSTCPPCVTMANNFEPALTQLNGMHPGSNIAVIKYEMNWPSPGNDASYNTHGVARKNYYAVSGVPDHFVNGEDGISFTSPTAAFKAEMEGINKGGPADFEIKSTYLIENASATEGKYNINVQVIPQKDMTGDYTVHIAVVERHYTNPAATTSLKEYHYVMRQMFPSGNGTKETAWTKDDTTKMYKFEDKAFKVGGVTQNSFNLWGDPFATDLVVWVQDNATKNVLQADHINPQWKNDPLSIDEVNTFENILMYPNPTTNNASLTFSIEKATDFNLTVVDAVGRVVYNISDYLNAGTHKASIPSSDFASGVYTVILKSDNGTSTQRLSVVK